jgi:hypothetical protein
MMNRKERCAAARKDLKLARKARKAKCLNDLVKLRSERRKTENGFEAQTRKDEELRIKNERHQMKKEHHEWDVRLKDAKFCHLAGQNVANFNKAARENPGFEAQYNAELAKHAAS